MPFKYAPCLEQAIARWQQTLLLRGCSQNTMTQFPYVLRRIISYMAEIYGHDMTLEHCATLTRNDFRQWQHWHMSLGYAAQTQHGQLSVIRSFYKFLHAHYEIDNPAVFALKRAKMDERVPRDLSYEEIMDVIEVLKSQADLPWIAARDVAIIMVMYGAGLRIGEACALTIADVRRAVASGKITVRGKGNKERQVPILACVSDALHEALTLRPHSSTDRVFLNKWHEPLQSYSFAKHLKDYRRAGLLSSYVTCHAFRHSFASHLHASGMCIRHIQQLLGHVSLNTTQIYTRVTTQHVVKQYRKGFG